MKNVKHLWALALSLIMGTALFMSTANQTNATQASVTITEWQDTDCSLDDYIWTGLTVSSADQALTERTHNIVCGWMTNNSKTVTISLPDLTGSAWTISKNNFTGTLNGTVNTNGSLTSAMATVSTSVNMWTSHTLFTKSVNTIWTYTGSIAIKGTLPWGTAAWTYAGTINITNQ